MHPNADVPEPAVRKEVFDYLRNVQKETEIRARLSGINIWVLYGGIGFMCWTLLDPNSPSIAPKTWRWAMFCAELLVCIGLLITTSRVSGRDNDLRFRPAWMASKTSLSPHWCMRYLWLASPFTISGSIWGFGPVSIVIPVMMSLLIFGEMFVSKDSDDVDFLLTETKKGRWFAIFISVGFIVATIFENSDIFMNSSISLSKSEIKSVATLVTIYYLVLLLIKRGVTDNADAWTYQLERKLLLGLSSVQEALSVIESHSLGQRLMIVLGEKRSDITIAIDEIKNGLSRVTLKIPEIEKISPEYVHERDAQFSQLSKPIFESLSKYDAAVDKIDHFAKRLAEKNKSTKDKRIDKLVEDLSRDVGNYKLESIGFKHEMLKYERKVFGNARDASARGRIA